MIRTFTAAALVALLALPGAAAPVVVTTQGDDPDLAQPYSTEDILQGLIPDVLEGDNGWHPANEDPADHLPAFTDGIGMRPTGLTGLLNDFPGWGNPTKLVDYVLDQPYDINEIRVFTGNEGRDGRVFHTYTVSFSSDGELYSEPIYVQSHPSGTLNNAQNNQWSRVLTQLTDDAGALANGVTHIRFHFYSVDNTGGQNRDAWDDSEGRNPVNPFTGTDDALTHAFVSPLVLEIDVFGSPSQAVAVDSIGEAKALPDGTIVTVTDTVLTKDTDTHFFAQEMDRSAGVRVISDVAVTPFVLASFEGIVQSDPATGEKYIDATGREVPIGAILVPPEPLMVGNRALGGGLVTGSDGLANDGLYVVVWGRVTGIDLNFPFSLYIDDGSGAPNDTPEGTVASQVPGVKITPVSSVSVNEGEYVTVTGIVRLQESDGQVIPVVEPHTDSSIVVESP